MQEAVLAIEDRSFYSHPGVNPLRLAAVAVRSAIGSESLGGTSTITQQLSRMFFLADEFNAELQSGERGRTWGSYLRKAREGLMSLVLERKASKDEILELYLNDVYLGQRGSFAIHGVAEASRIFFGKDVANVSISEAAVIAGVIQSPASRSPFANPKRSTERRNVVLRAMADEGYITDDEATKAMREPLVVAARGVDNEAPYFVDMVSQQVARALPAGARGLAQRGGLHHARPQPAARGARRDAQRPRTRGQAAGRAAPQPRPHRPVGAHRHRPQDRRDPRARRRPLLQPVAVQPGDDQPAAAGLGVQAVRVPGRVRPRGARGPHRPDAGLR